MSLREALREEYKGQDVNQQMYSRRFLEIYKTKYRSNTADVLRYCRQFSAISRNLVAKGKLGKHIARKSTSGISSKNLIFDLVTYLYFRSCIVFEESRGHLEQRISVEQWYDGGL